MGTPIIFLARELVEHSTEALEITIMKCCKRSNEGKYLVPVVGYQTLSHFSRESLANRLLNLEASAVIVPVDLEEMSTPLDAEDLIRRLSKVKDAEVEARFAIIDMNVPVFSRSQATSKMSKASLGQRSSKNGFDVEKAILEAEKQAFIELEQDGCCSMVDHGLLDEDHHVLIELIDDLAPWNAEWRYRTGGYPLISHNRSVLQRQRHKWRLFRAWQHLNRQLDISPPKAFESFLAEGQRVDVAGGLDLREETWPAYVEHVRRRWERYQAQYQCSTARLRAKSCCSWMQYIAQVRQRLVDVKCDLDFSPSHDLADQDELTTLIKYLNFEIAVFEDIDARLELAAFNRDIDWLDLQSEDFMDTGDTPENLTARDTVLGQLKQANDLEEEANKQLKKIRKIVDVEPFNTMISEWGVVALWNRWNLILEETIIRSKGLERSIRRIGDFLRLQNVLLDYQKKHSFQLSLLEWTMSRVRRMVQEGSVK